MQKRPENMVKISEIAKAAGVMNSTIRFYTDIGLLKKAGETIGGHRLYDKNLTLSKIKKIQFLIQKGLTIEQIKTEMVDAESKKKILVIDDEPEVGHLIEGVVSASFPGFTVKIVRDGFSAGNTLNEFFPDLIVLDIMLPGVNGFDVCRQIRSNKLFSNLKILAITGYDSPENRSKILECGANDFLAKPLEVPSLEDKINKLLNLKA